MYPNLYFFLKEVLGIELQGFKLVNTFGLMVAFAFGAAAWALTSELKRRQRNGWLTYTEQEIWVGKGAAPGDIIWNAFFGFIIGWKFVGFFLHKEAAYADPQGFLLSGQGSLQAGVLFALLLAGLKWYGGNKTKLKTPEKRHIRIWPHDRVGDMIIFAAVLGFGGAKIFHNLENWEDLVRDPLDALLSFSGLTFYGGLICAGAGIIWYAKKHNINLWHLCDSFGPALMLAYAVGRIGCQVAGDGDWGILNSAYVADVTTGKAVLADSATFDASVNQNIAWYKQAFHGVKEISQASDVPHASFRAPSWIPSWAVAYTYPNNVLSEGIPIAGCDGQWCNRLPNPVFPTPFYETLMGLILFGILWAIRKRLPAAGMLFGFYLVFNGVERFFIEKMRVNTTYSIAGFHPTQAEIISSCLVLAGIVIIFLRRKATYQPA